MENTSSPKKLSEIWRMTLSQLQLNMSSMAFKTWFIGSNLLEMDDKIAKVGFKSAYIKDHVETHYRNLLQRALAKASGIDSIEPVFSISPTNDSSEQNEYEEPIFSSTTDQSYSTQSTLNTDTSYATSAQVKTSTKDDQNVIQKSGLNPRYTFENFVIGADNKLAHAAALAVADNPGTTYNPLFIYGGVGLGKTHILQAIGIEILRKKPSTKILYIPAETFLNEMVESIRFKKSLEFREKYRNIDVLIIDDVQVISGKDGTQDELFHTYNVMYQANKQIIFAADRPPKEIQNLTDRLRSRFEGGMVADIKPPDFETRLAILKQKADEKNLFLPDYHLRLIAETNIGNIRELEGALTKIGTFYYLNNNSLTEEEVRSLLRKDLDGKKAKVKAADIISSVAKSFDLKISDIKGKRRTAKVALARQVVMYLLRTDLNFTLEEAAHQVKRKDHTTVLHAVEKIEDMISTDDLFSKKISEIKRVYSEPQSPNGSEGSSQSSRSSTQ